MKTKPDPQTLDAMHRDPDNWRGLFYVNRKDPRIMVPKRILGLGWTFNFAHPMSWLVVFGLIVAIVALGVMGG